MLTRVACVLPICKPTHLN